eukprot:TRINITY_DN9305_c0_g1_i11.p1 TRINITY_DN9305_c0_g1~~TRINITY_DN9305_c0_g1_i11.p1  ORF type:complete len:602 (-),score=182.36 TRINITY_DN9305_c0_g1_i11:111-1916(-)
MGCIPGSDTKIKGKPTYSRKGAQGNELDDAISHALVPNDDLRMQVELHFECNDLINMDVGSLTDSVVVVYAKTQGGYRVVGSTEVIADNLNPVFVQSVVLDYFFEERQELRLSVFDVDDFSETASPEQNLIGSVELFLHEVVTSPHNKLTRPLINPKKAKEKLGNLVIVCEEKKRGSRIMYKIVFEGKNFAPEYIFYRLNRIKGAGQYIPIVESETCKKNTVKQTHLFNEVCVTKADLLSDDVEKRAMVEVFKWSDVGAHTSLGKQEFLIGDLMEGATLQFQASSLRAVRCEELSQHSFLDYILNGLEIALIIAIDFTGSNGSPKYSDSLHYYDFSQNQYLKAITSVGQILENYDSDKKFSVFGFGAFIPDVMPSTSHCFAINGNIFDPEISTLQGVFNTYKEVLKTLEFSGPTYFAEVLNYVNNMIEYETKKQNKYYILLLMTDGIIDDMEKTTNEIVRATSLPLSIIIVGIGNNNFSSMKILDADDVPLYSKKLNKKMERDIVQFVPFNDFKNDHVKLAKETLEEVPRQLVSYMNSKGIPPEKGKLANSGGDTFFAEHYNRFVKELTAKGYDGKKIEAVLSKGIEEASANLFETKAKKV